MCITESLRSQSFHPPIENYTPKEYGIENTPENWDIIQDDRGIIYSAVGNNVLEYDGTHWRSIPVVKGRYTVSLAKSKKGIIYVGAQQDFGYLEPDKEGKMMYHSLISKLSDETVFSTIWKVSCIDEKVYFQSEEAIFVYDGTSIKTIKPSTSFHILFNVEGQLFVRQREKGLYLINGEQLEFCKGTDTLANQGVFAMIPNKKGILLFTREMGLWNYQTESNHLTKIATTDEAELSNAAILGGELLSDGLIALNTIESGVLIVNHAGEIKQRINKSTGIRVNDVKSIFEDRENNLWLALNNGISKINYNSPLSFYSEESGLEGSVQSITHYHKHLIVGTSSGLFIHQESANSKEFIQHPAIHSQVWDFFQLNGKLLIGAGDGLYALSGSNADSIQLIYQVNVNAIAHFKESNEILLAGSQGILILNADNFAEVDYSAIPISGITGKAFNPSPKFSDSELWIGTNAMGLIRVQSKNGFYDYTMYQGEEDGLDNQWVEPFVIGDSIVFGNPEGLNSFRDEHYLIPPGESIESYASVKGMFDTYKLNGEKIDFPVRELIDSKTRIWACVDERIMYFDKSNNFQHVRRPFWGINFGRINQFFQNEDDKLWIGTADGLIRYLSDDKKDYAIPFYTIIRNVTIGKDVLNYFGGHGTQPQDEGQYKIDYKHNSISFSFSAPYFDDEHDIEFSYLLEGQESEWSEWNKNTKIDFSSLREGDYVFRVKARNIYNQESKEAVVRFTIHPPWYRTTWAYVIYILILIILILIMVRISSLRLKRKNEHLETLVTERTKEIASKNTELQKQKDEIQHQQTEIMDSINYAQRIQEAILPVDQEMKNAFKDSFVLFLPKDIVSGDFYWFAQVDNKSVVVCADCTGHGVPGAFMSMIGSDKLNQFVKEKKITEPGLILSEVNQGIKSSLKQIDDNSSTKDGMDAAIVTFDKSNNTLQYAGANRALWLVRNGELIETKATKAAVGGFTADDQVFELNELTIQDGDSIYLSTDGYADQFGGPKGKKLKVKIMKQLILDNHQLPMIEQQEIYHKALIDWMGEIEQVDDVCVIGLKF